MTTVMRQVLIIMALFGQTAWANSRILHSEVRQSTDADNPGMALHITRLGLDYVQALGLQILNEQIPRLKIPDLDRKLDDGQGKIKMRNTRIVEYYSPQESELHVGAPNRATFDIKGMGMKARGKFDGTYKVILVPVRSQGNFEAILDGLNHRQDIIVSSTPEGKPKVRAGKCRVSIRSVLVTIRNSGFLMDLTLNTFKQLISDRVKPMLEQEICTVVAKMINRDANAMLDTYPMQIPLGASGFGDFTSVFGGSEKSPKKKSNKGGKKEPVLMLDYSMKGQPVFEKDRVTIPVKGEISWDGKGGTPFNPPDLGPFPLKSSKMLYIHASDFLLNSLLYHSFTKGLLNFKFNRYTQPKLGGLLRTSCDDDLTFCMGDLLESLADQHPNHDVELQFIPTKVPAFLFRDRKIKVIAEGEYKMLISPEKNRQRNGFRSPPREIIWADLNFDADVGVQLKRGEMKIVGAFEIQELKTKLTKSKVRGFDQDTLDDLTAFAEDAMNDEATNLLKKGMPLPDVQGMRWKRPTGVQSTDRYLVIKSWFQLNKRLISTMVQAAAASFDP